MRHEILIKLRTAAAFVLIYCAILNALFADNTYFRVFAVCGILFSAVLFVFCLKEDNSKAYKAVFAVLFSSAAVFAVLGLAKVIAGYRIGALLFLVISVLEMIMMQKRAGKRVFAHIAAVVFAYVPLTLALCFIFCDIKPELCGNKTEQITYNGGYDTVSKRTYTTSRGYSLIYYPETDDPAGFPVIAYLHGFYIYNNTESYEDTLYYLASCGYIVIAPNYESMFLDPANYTECASVQIEDGIAFAEKRLKAKPAKKNGDLKIGLVGHSVGAVTALNICAENRLPVKFVAALDASDGGVDLIPKNDPALLAPDLNVLMAIGEDDTEDAYRIISYYQNGLSEHSEDKKAFYILHSKEHGAERVIADHVWMKDNGSTTDNLIRYGAYKWCKAIADWSFYGKDYDLWHGEEALYMGEWSDGTPLPFASYAGDKLK